MNRHAYLIYLLGVVAGCSGVAYDQTGATGAALAGNDDGDPNLPPDPTTRPPRLPPLRVLDAGADAKQGPTYPDAAASPAGNAINQVVRSARDLPGSTGRDSEPCTDGPASIVVHKDSKQRCFLRSCSESNSPLEIASVSQYADALFPGDVIHGRSFAAGALDPVPLPRAAGRVVLDLINGTSAPLGAAVDPPSLSKTTDTINSLLGSIQSPLVGSVVVHLFEIHSQDQLTVKIGAKVKGSSWAVQAGFQFDDNDDKSRFLMEFTQSYFTLSFENPASPADFFAPTVTAEQLAPYVNTDDPLLYLANVSYGRKLYFLIESSMSSSDLKATIAANFNVSGIGGGIDGGLGIKHSLSEVDMRSYAIGGDATPIVNTLGSTKDAAFSAVKAWLDAGAHFGPNSPGVPLSYSARHVADLASAGIQLTTDYHEHICADVPRNENWLNGSDLTKAATIVGFSTDVIQLGACHPGFVRDYCEVIVKNRQNGNCWLDVGVSGAQDGWVNSDPHDCRCGMHMGGGGLFAGVTCQVRAHELEDLSLIQTP